MKDWYEKPIFTLAQIELLDVYGKVIYRGGENMNGFSNWYETTIRKDERLVGFRCVTCKGPGCIQGIGVITLKNEP